MTHAAPDSRIDRQLFIDAMRRVASSVAVVTTDGAAGRHGATVSAFCSVSADPPAVLVCLNDRSRIADRVRGNGRFALNVLPEGARDLAARFAGAEDGRRADRFDGLDHGGLGHGGLGHGGGDSPILPGATALSCRVVEAMLSGSHRVFIGEVTAIRHGAARPLAYLDGAYHRVAPFGAQDPAPDPAPNPNPNPAAEARP